ncbi:MAG TPA: SpoIIE family protein phosphatase [Armatimonadota bacterium]|nr:SpoIIE family protein phosphatase [Armatimonadota bacterium]
MRRSALVILVCASIAVLLLVAAAARSQGFTQPHPYMVASWLAAVLAFGVFAVMLAEYFIHGRQLYLYLSAAFLAIGIMGVWNALIAPYRDLFQSGAAVSLPPWGNLSLWESQWITLALMLIVGVAVSGRATSRQHRDSVGTAVVIVAGVLWASVVIFAVSTLPSVSGIFAAGRTGAISSVACGVIFAIACFVYSRAAIHKGNAVLAWMSYGLMFAVLAQAAMVLDAEPSESLLGFAEIMKLLVFASPLAGMLAEHTSLQVRLRDQAAELSGLIQTQQAISLIATPAELYQRIVELVSVSLPSASVCLLLFEKDRGLLRVAAQVGLDDEAARQLIFRPGEGPPGDSFSNRETIFVQDVLEDPVLFQKLGGVSGVRSAVLAPLIAKDECLGVLALFFSGLPRRIQKMAKDQLRLLEALASQAALAVDGFRLRGRVLDSTKATDASTRELEIVWEIGQVVASKLELHALVDALAERLKAAVGATACCVLAFEPDVVGLRIMGHKKLTRHQSIADHVDQCDVVAAAVARSGEPVIANDIPNSPHCKYPEMAAEDGGTHHLLSVPVSLRGFVGAISMFRQNAEPFGEREKRLLVRLGPVVAAGIRNADLYERERKIAESLERTMLPDLDREFADIQVAMQYQAAYDECLVGGDFYEVIDFGEGRYAIAMGDVAGKGLDAAVYTAMSRYMIQAYSADDPDPVSVVSKLNTALCRYTPSGKFVTAVYGIVDAKSKTFTYVNAGHEIPFLYRSAADNLGVLATTGPAVGALADGEYTSEEVPFEPGDMLIFYTDGATEARSNGKFLGTEGLQKIVADNLHRGFDGLPEVMLTGVRSYAKGYLRDDVAILIVKARTPGALF